MLALAIVLPAFSPGAFAAPAPAKVAAEASGVPPTPELKALVHTLQDKDQREQLIKQLNALIASQQALHKQAQAGKSAGGGLQQQVTDWLNELRARSGNWVTQFEGFSRARALYERVAKQLHNPATRRLWLRELGEMLAALIAAMLAGWLCRRLLRASAKRLVPPAAASRVLKAASLVGHTLLELAPLAVFVAVGYAVVGALRVSYAATALTLALINAIGLSRAVQALGTALIAPDAKGLRLLRMSEETANYWLVWLRRFAVVGVYGFIAVNAASAIGLPPGQTRALNNVVGLLVTVMLVLLILQNRGTVGALLRAIPGDETPGAMRVLFNRAADLWHWVASIYVVAIYLVGLFNIPNGLNYLVRATVLSAFVIGGAKIVSSVTERGLNRLFSISADLKRRLPGLEKRVNRYVPVVLLCVRGVIYLVAALLVLQVWRLNIFGWLSTPTGQHVIGTAVSIAFAIAVATALWEGLNLAIESYLGERTDAKGNHKAPSARALTVMPLLRAVLAITLGTVTALIVLSQLGINIGPLLAGAGILGLAVGFGSQTLVKDFITGLFILLQDIVAVGDYVQMGGNSGTVEALSIRSIRLRDLNGNVHVIPFSDVTTVTNMTKDYSYALFDMGVAYREDMDEVMRVMKAVADEMREDTQWAPSILGAPEIFGVNAFGDSAITVRLRLKTVAGAQWQIQREFNRRVKRRFDELDIEIPFPHQTIYFGVDKSGNAPPAHLSVERPSPNTLPADSTGSEDSGDEPSAATE